MKKLLFALAAMATFTTNSIAQNMSEMCGTTDWHLIDARLVENVRAADAGIYNSERAMAKYVPIKFHLIAKKDGTGRLAEAKVFENLCQLNKDYQDQNFIFYMADGTISYIDDNNAYNDQSNALGAATLEAKRSKTAINIYFGANTPSPSNPNNPGLGGTTLGYYSPSRDWLVIRNDQVNNTSGTLSHELGHYFSLKHVFSGWDAQSFLQKYDAKNSPNENWNNIPNWFKVPVTVASDGTTPIECFNGSNCKTAGDRMCDTPADYNFGYGWTAGGGCGPFTKKLIGPCAQDSIKDVQEENFMGYFIGCSNYIFTTEQKAAILADYNSTKRGYIRSNYTPAIETISTNATNLTPSSGTTQFYDFVTLDWDDVPNADKYIVEIDRIFTFGAYSSLRFTTNSSSLIVNKLEAGKKYFWRVLPFDVEGGTCKSFSSVASFTTSNFTIAAKEIESLNRWEVSPNPVRQGNTLFVDLDVTKGFDANIGLYNAIGQEVKSIGNQYVAEGQTRFSFETADLTQGVYFVRFQTGKGTESKRVVISE